MLFQPQFIYLVDNPNAWNKWNIHIFILKRECSMDHFFMRNRKNKTPLADVFINGSRNFLS